MKKIHCLLQLVFCLSVLTIIGNSQSNSDPTREIPSLQPSQLPVLSAGTHQQTVSLPTGESLRYTIFIPPNLKPNKSVPLIVTLHYGYLPTKTPFWGGDFMNDLTKPAFENFNAIIVAPDSMRWETWNTPTNEQAVRWLTQSIVKSYKIKRQKILLCGFSMGARGTWYLGGRLQDLFTAAILVAGKPFDDHIKWKIPLSVIHSKKDNVYAWEFTQRYLEKIKSEGAQVEITVLEDAQHHEVEKYINPLKQTQNWLNKIWKQ